MYVYREICVYEWQLQLRRTFFFCILQLNHSESERRGGGGVNGLSSFNKLQTRFPKEPGIGGLFVVQVRYIYNMHSAIHKH